MNRLTKQDAYWMGEEFWTSAEEPSVPRNIWLWYKEAIAWQPLPAPYRLATEQDNPSGSWQEQMMGAFLGDSRL